MLHDHKHALYLHGEWRRDLLGKVMLYDHKDTFYLQIMVNEGGIYLDLDAVPLRPFDDLISGKYEAVFGWEHLGMYTPCKYLYNCVVMCMYI